jgi:hypothetical protein
MIVRACWTCYQHRPAEQFARAAVPKTDIIRNLMMTERGPQKVNRRFTLVKNSSGGRTNNT